MPTSISEKTNGSEHDRDHYGVTRSLRNRYPLCLALPLLLAINPGCVAKRPPVHADAFYTVEEGRVVRMPAYRGEYPVLGQCVNDKDYALVGEICVEGQAAKPELRILEKQGYRSRSKLVSVQTGVAADVAGQSAKADISVTKYRMLIEWNRYTIFAVDPAEETAQAADKPYVSAVEYGIGVRIMLDISLTKVGTKADVKFGLGTIAAHLDAGHASVAVTYDTIGVPYDILPEGLPTTIESVNDITRMIEGLHEAVHKVSDSWNEIVKETPGITMGAVLDTNGKYASGPFVDGPLSDEDWKVLQDIIAAASSIESKRADLTVNLPPPLTALSKMTQRTYGPQLGPVLEELQALRAFADGLDAAQKSALNALAPFDGALIDKAIDVLRKYYPHDPAWNGTLFPRTFSAAPVAYYVVRSAENIAWDRCKEENLEKSALSNTGKKSDCEEKAEEAKAAEEAKTAEQAKQPKVQQQSQEQAQ